LIIGECIHSICRTHIDFADCEAELDSVMITQEDTREAYDEQRLKSLGVLRGRVLCVIWTERDEGPHLISIRKGTRHEQRLYFDQIGH
jgi:uncharacterized DUF497 family protein